MGRQAIIYMSIAIGSLVAFYLAIDSWLTYQGPSIATLVEKRGVVQVRPEDISLWNDAENNQDFFERDVVQTGPNSYARIVFENGKLLEVGPNSQVLLVINREDVGKDKLLVTLYKGDLRFKSSNFLSKVSQALSSSIIVDSLNQRLLIDGKAELEVNKATEKSSLNFLLLKGNAVVTDKKTNSQRLVKGGDQRKKPEQEKINYAELVKKSKNPVLLSPRIGSELWLLRNDGNQREKSVRLRLSINVPQSDRKHLKPFIRFGRQSRSWKPLLFQDGSTQISSRVALSSLLRRAVSETRNGYETRRVYFQTGYKTAEGKTISQSQVRSFYVSSVLDLPAKRMIAISNMAKRPKRLADGQWFITSERPDQSNIDLYLMSPFNLDKFYGYLNGSESFYIKALPKGKSMLGTMMMSGSDLIAFTPGTRLSREKSTRFARHLESDLLFQGRTNDYIKRKDLTPEKLARTLNKRVRRNSIYVFDGENIFNVNKKLIKEDQAGYGLVMDLGEAFFANKVKIVQFEKRAAKRTPTPSTQ